MARGADTDGPGHHSHARVLVVATDELAGTELIGELGDHLHEASSTEVMVIVPAVEQTAFLHALGDADKAVREAGRRLETHWRNWVRAESQARWFEDGLFERAQEELRPALRMITSHHD